MSQSKGGGKGAKYSPQLWGGNPNLQIQETHQIPKITITKKAIPMHIIV